MNLITREIAIGVLRGLIDMLESDRIHCSISQGEAMQTVRDDNGRTIGLRESEHGALMIAWGIDAETVLSVAHQVDVDPVIVALQAAIEKQAGPRKAAMLTGMGGEEGDGRIVD